MGHWAENFARRVYEITVYSRVSDRLTLQRFQLLWFGWYYWRLLFHPQWLWKFLKVDWDIVHGHTPDEMAIITRAISQRPQGGVFVEAGCWNGGSTCKFSLMCKEYGYTLHVYDSFQGVEDVSQVPGEWDFSGKYAAAQALVQHNVSKYGWRDSCSFHPGWFKDTMAGGIPGTIAAVYIDCDTAKGTMEVLRGVVPSLSDDAVFFSQDYHISPVKKLLKDSETWKQFGVSARIEQKTRRLARIWIVRGK